MALKVLVADDSITIHKLVSLALKEEDVIIYTVSNGEEAIKKIDEIKPDVVLADIFMPRLTGYEVCSFVKGRSDLSSIPVVLMVGSFEPFDESEAESCGYDGVLVKPFETQQLINSIKNAIEKSKREAVSSKDEYAETILDKTMVVEDLESREDVGRSIPELDTQVKRVVAKVPEPSLRTPEEVVGQNNLKVSVEKKSDKPLTGELDILDIPQIEIGKSSLDEEDDILGVCEEILIFNSPSKEEKPILEEEKVVTAPKEEEIILEDVSEKENVEVYKEPEEVEITSEPEVKESIELPQEEKVEKVKEEIKKDIKIDEKLIDEIVNRVIDKLSSDIIEKIAWEVVPELAELMIKKHLEK